MEEDIKSMPSWFWYVAAAVAAYGVYAYLKAKAAGTVSAPAAEVAAITSSAGVTSPTVSSGSGVDLTGVTSSLGGITSSLNALPGTINASLAQGVAGLGAGMTQLEADIKSYIAQQDAAITAGMGAMANQIDSQFAVQLKAINGLSTLINNENSSITTLTSTTNTDVSNQDTLAGLQGFNVAKSELGGLNTTNDAIAKAAPSCVTGSGNSAKIDFACLGKLILAGSVNPSAL